MKLKFCSNKWFACVAFFALLLTPTSFASESLATRLESQLRSIHGPDWPSFLSDNSDVRPEHIYQGLIQVFESNRGGDVEVSNAALIQLGSFSPSNGGRFGDSEESFYRALLNDRSGDETFQMALVTSLRNTGSPTAADLLMNQLMAAGPSLADFTAASLVEMLKSESASSRPMSGSTPYLPNLYKPLDKRADSSLWFAFYDKLSEQLPTLLSQPEIPKHFREQLRSLQVEAHVFVTGNKKPFGSAEDSFQNSFQDENEGRADRSPNSEDTESEGLTQSSEQTSFKWSHWYTLGIVVSVLLFLRLRRKS